MNNLLTGTEETSYLGRLWQSIEDMPIYNWIKILETGDLKWLFVKNKGRVSSRSQEHWMELQQEYLDEFGLDEQYKQRLRLTQKLTNLNLDFVLTGDRFTLNLIKMAEADIEALNQGESVKFYQVLDHVEKYKGFAIDPKKTSVIKWYYTLKNISDGQAD